MRSRKKGRKSVPEKKQENVRSAQLILCDKQSIFYSHRFFFLFLAGSVIYHFIVSTWFGAKYGTDGISYTLHIINYEFGFCSKFLPGAVFSFLFPHPTATAITIYESVLLFGVISAVSAMLEKLMLLTPEKDKRNVLILIFLYLCGTATFSMMFQELGLLDAYWIYLSVLFIPCLQSKVFRFILPVIFILAVLIHFASIVSYIPFFSLLLLYELSVTEEKKDRVVYSVIFVICILLSVSGSMYFLLRERQNLVYSDVAEFNNALKARGAEYFIYFDYTFFDDYSFLPDSDLPSFLLSGTFLPTSFELIINKVLMQMYYCYLIHKDLNYIMYFVHIVLFLLLLPVYISVYRILIAVRKKSADNKLKQFTLFCALFQAPLTYISGVMFSTDPRWACHAYLTLMTFFLFILYKNRDLVLPMIAEEMQKYTPLQKMVYLLIYGVFTFEPYI